MACFHLSYNFELWDGVSKTGFYLWEFCKTLEARRPERVVFTHARHRHSQSGARDLMFLHMGFPRKHKMKTWSYECAADSFPDPRRFPRQHLPWWGVPRDALAKQSHGEAGVTQCQPVQPRACPTPEGLLGPRLGLGRLSRLLGAVSPPHWNVASLLTWGFRCLRSQRKLQAEGFPWDLDLLEQVQPGIHSGPVWGWACPSPAAKDSHPPVQRELSHSRCPPQGSPQPMAGRQGRSVQTTCCWRNSFLRPGTRGWGRRRLCRDRTFTQWLSRILSSHPPWEPPTLPGAPGSPSRALCLRTDLR